MKRLSLAGLMFLGACTGNAVTDLQSNMAAVQQACAAVEPLVPLTLSLPTVGPFVAAGVQVGCGTAAGLAKLAADPSSVQWLAQQEQILKAALGR